MKGDKAQWADYWKKRARRATMNQRMGGMRLRNVVQQTYNGGAGDGPDQHAVKSEPFAIEPKSESFVVGYGRHVAEPI